MSLIAWSFSIILWLAYFFYLNILSSSTKASTWSKISFCPPLGPTVNFRPSELTRDFWVFYAVCPGGRSS